MFTHAAAVRAAVKAGYVLIERPDNEESRVYGKYYFHPPNQMERIPTGDKVVVDHKVIAEHSL